MSHIKNAKGKKISFTIPALVLLAIGFIFSIKGFIIAGVIVLFLPVIIFVIGFIILAVTEVKKALKEDK